MPETLAPAGGISLGALEELIRSRKLPQLVSDAQRRESYARYQSLKSKRERPGRYWKFDLDALDLDGADASEPRLEAIRNAPAARGVLVCDFGTARREHRALFESAFGAALQATPSKFAELTRAFLCEGTFISVPEDVALQEPIEIRYTATRNAAFPYTLVLAGKGAHFTVVEEVTGSVPNAFVCGVTEIVAAENAHVTYACLQTLPHDARSFFTRVAVPQRDATVQWATAELGAQLSVTSIDITIEQPGVSAQTAGLFFPQADQHVDMISTVDHRAGDAQSETIIKSAAIGEGQARYLGNIIIRPNSHGTEASLRDDALLLSKRAHIDSVPALEIAANDVKAFHGATVGAIDEEQIFYMTSRGLTRQAAERMIALGFFEPAIDRFPGEALRQRLREALEAKVLS